MLRPPTLEPRLGSDRPGRWNPGATTSTAMSDYGYTAYYDEWARATKLAVFKRSPAVCGRCGIRIERAGQEPVWLEVGNTLRFRPYCPVCAEPLQRALAARERAWAAACTDGATRVLQERLDAARAPAERVTGEPYELNWQSKAVIGLCMKKGL